MGWTCDKCNAANSDAFDICRYCKKGRGGLSFCSSVILIAGALVTAFVYLLLTGKI